MGIDYKKWSKQPKGVSIQIKYLRSSPSSIFCRERGFGRQKILPHKGLKGQGVLPPLASSDKDRRACGYFT